MKKAQLRQIKKIILNSATYKEMEEIILIMRERKRLIDINQEALKRQEVYDKIKDK